MSVEEIAITAEHTTAIGGLILDAIVGGAFHEATACTETSFFPGFSDCENAGSAAEAMPTIHVTTNFFPNISLPLCSTGRRISYFHQVALFKACGIPNLPNQ